jgi:hypothetical protein
MSSRSLLDLDIPPLVDAERLLADLSDQRTQRLLAAVALTVLAVVAALVLPQLWLVLAAGAVAALVTAAVAIARRRVLLSGLLQVREAYRLEAVSKAGSRFATRARRERLAAGLRSMVRAAEGKEGHPAYTAAALEERVLARKERLLGVAAVLEGREDELHPAGVAVVHRLLTRPSVSPLFNPRLNEQILDDALHRVEASAQGSTAFMAARV